METLYEQYGDQVDFYLVYVTEAHPKTEFSESSSRHQRAAAAEQLCSEYEISIPVLLDDALNSFANAYRVFSERAVLIDQGKIVFFNENELGPEGPDFAMVRKLESAIVDLLSSESDQLTIDTPRLEHLDAS